MGKIASNYKNNPDLLNEWQMMLSSLTEDVISENPNKIKKELR